MGVDINDYRRQRTEQANEVQPEPVKNPFADLPAVDVTEYLTENETFNNMARKMGVYLAQLKAIQQDCQSKLPESLNEQATRALSIQYWRHWGLENGVRAVLQALKQEAGGSK